MPPGAPIVYLPAPLRRETHVRIEASIDVAAPPAAIWDLLMQPAGYPEFMTPSDEITELGDGAVAPGYVYKERGGVPPIKSEITWTVAAAEPGQRLVTDGTDGKVGIHLEWILAETDPGTHLVHTMELQPAWFLAPVMAVMWPLLMRKRAQEALDGTMANVKRMVEAA